MRTKLDVCCLAKLHATFQSCFVDMFGFIYGFMTVYFNPNLLKGFEDDSDLHVTVSSGFTYMYLLPLIILHGHVFGRCDKELIVLPGS